jgi:hypothetical protein
MPMVNGLPEMVNEPSASNESSESRFLPPNKGTAAALFLQTADCSVQMRHLYSQANKCLASANKFVRGPLDYSSQLRTSPLNA